MSQPAKLMRSAGSARPFVPVGRFCRLRTDSDGLEPLFLNAFAISETEQNIRWNKTFRSEMKG